jgi:chorismate mutase
MTSFNIHTDSTKRLIDLLSERAAFGQAALATSWGTQHLSATWADNNSLNSRKHEREEQTQERRREREKEKNHEEREEKIKNCETKAGR